MLEEFLVELIRDKPIGTYLGSVWILVAVGIVWTQKFTQRGMRFEKKWYEDLLASPLRRWLTFRNAWGDFWATRIRLRVNQTAELQQWPIRLWPSGFKAVDENADVEITEELAASVEKTLDALLWRFEEQSP